MKKSRRTYNGVHLNKKSNTQDVVEQSLTNNETSTFWMKDASYLRLKNLELGYNIPDCLCQKFAIQRMRVYFTGLNLLTFTQVRNWDAEKFAGDTENFNYPQLKSYSIGLNITF